MRTCQNFTLGKIVIEGISYFLKQFDTCTCTPQPSMVKDVVAVAAAATFQLNEKIWNIKFFHWKAKTLAEKIKSKLEQYCKGSKENNKKLLVQQEKARSQFGGIHFAVLSNRGLPLHFWSYHQHICICQCIVVFT